MARLAHIGILTGTCWLWKGISVKMIWNVVIHKVIVSQSQVRGCQNIERSLHQPSYHYYLLVSSCQLHCTLRHSRLINTHQSNNGAKLMSHFDLLISPSLLHSICSYASAEEEADISRHMLVAQDLSFRSWHIMLPAAMPMYLDHLLEFESQAYTYNTPAIKDNDKSLLWWEYRSMSLLDDGYWYLPFQIWL